MAEYEITDHQLRVIMPTLSQNKREQYLPHLNEAMDALQINTPLRAAAFLAQIAHESVDLRFMAEVWGPTEQQKKYEPHTHVSQSLGNVEEGDGYKYRGRGPIQITGRSNYEKFGALIGEDLVTDPDAAADPKHAFKIAAHFWDMHKLNEFADKKDILEITKKINGGTTGLANRETKYKIALKALGVE